MMKKIGRIVLSVLSILFLAILCFIISIPVTNNCIAANVAMELSSLPLPEQTQSIEKISRAGKLIGSGNGMQYFGAVLLKSDLSLDELTAYYSGIAEDGRHYTVERQTGKQIEVIEHGSMEFHSDIDASNYYILYAWGSHPGIFADLDLRGH